MGKQTYYQKTTVRVSAFLKKNIYCVTLFQNNSWFEDKDEAEKYKGFLFELYFFSHTSCCLSKQIVIKEYQIDKI